MVWYPGQNVEHPSLDHCPEILAQFECSKQSLIQTPGWKALPRTHLNVNDKNSFFNLQNSWEFQVSFSSWKCKIIGKIPSFYGEKNHNGLRSDCIAGNSDSKKLIKPF